MRFKDLSDKDKELIKKTYNDKSNTSWEKRAAKLGDKLGGVSERTIRRWVSQNLGLKEKIDFIPDDLKIASNKKIDKTKKYYLVSWCQNNTPLNKGLVTNMEAYAKHIDAEIIIIPGKYRPNVGDNEVVDYTWDSKISKYLCVNRFSPHKNLTILSDINIIATASDPLNGLEGLSHEASSVLGHCRQHQHALPVLGDDKIKILFTTGSISKKNFGSSKVAKKAEFHHIYGFLIIEVENDEIFHARQVSAIDNGNFCDLYYKVENGKVSRNNEIVACIMGDIHCGQEDPLVINQTFNLFKKLKPEYVILHDLFSSTSISHHNLNNPFKQYQNMLEGKSSLKKEIDYMLDWIDRIEDKYKLVVVRSNHDAHLERWLVDFNFKLDKENMKEYIDYTSIMLSGKAKKGLIPYIVNERFPKVKTLAMNESFKLKGWELGQHGSEGSNGSRGSSTSFRKLNTKIITGHTHSPLRKDGHVCVGTATYLKLDYNNKGSSSWVNANAIIDNFGKTQLIHFIGKNKTFTTFK